MVFYNEDWIHFLWTRYNAGVEVNEDTLKEYIYSLKDTQITDFAMNVNGTVSTAPSKVLETFADKYLSAEENGTKVDYTDTFAKTAYLLKEKNIDMYAVWISALKETGINPWISIRMNDCHGNMEKTDLRKSKYVEEYSQYNVSAHRNAVGYFDRQFDYSHKQVRNTVLKYIEEMIARYDVYGLELDLTRDMVFFSAGFEAKGRALMTELINEIYALLEKYGEKYGHKIKLLLLVHPSYQDCFERGIDVLSVCDKIDFVTLISRWETTDTDMPIELWKQLLKDTDIKLGGGQQLLFAPYRRKEGGTISSVKMAFGQAIANLSRGCDFVYLYNYMDNSESEGELADMMYDGSIRNDANRSLIFGNIGKIETLLKQERSHVITYSDFAAIPLNVHSVLPVIFKENTDWYEILKFAVGPVSSDKKVRLILGINRDDLNKESFRIYVNSAECRYIEKTYIENSIYKNSCYVFSIEENLFETMIAEINVNLPCEIQYAEIEVINR